MRRFTFAMMSAAFAIASTALAPAFGVTLTPPGAGNTGISISIQGALKLTKGSMTVPCQTTLRGTVDGAGSLRITAASFTGDWRCGKIKTGLSEQTPWTGKLSSTSELIIDNLSVQVTVPIFGGTCGPNRVSIGVTDTGTQLQLSAQNVKLTGGCAMNGQLTTTPYVHVAQ